MKMMLILKMMQLNSLLHHFQKIIYNVNSIFFFYDKYIIMQSSVA